MHPRSPRCQSRGEFSICCPAPRRGCDARAASRRKHTTAPISATYLLPTVYYLLPPDSYRLPPLPTTYYLLFTAYCLLPATCYLIYTCFLSTTVYCILCTVKQVPYAGSEFPSPPPRQFLASSPARPRSHSFTDASGAGGVAEEDVDQSATALAAASNRAAEDLVAVLPATY